MAAVRVLKTVIKRRFSSALYITGDKAQSNYVVLTPHIDFDEQIKRKDDLVKSIKARKLNIDLDKIEKRWAFFKMLDDHKTVLEVTRNEINVVIGKLKQEPQKNAADIEKLQLHVKLVKDDLKNIKDYSYGIDENANLGVLSLPNLLHPQTPINNTVTCHEFLDQPKRVDKSHVDVAKSLNLIVYVNPTCCFLKSDAALLEFSLTNYFQENLLKMGFTQFSNADFARSVVVDGCGDRKIFTLEGSNDELNRLHLVGGGSLHSFMAYFAKHSLQAAALPLKFFSLGRKYVSGDTGSDLFNLSQNSVARVFVAFEDDRQMDETLHALTQQIIQLYEPLGYHFKLVYVPASDLEKGESLRVSVQMLSNFLQKYVEVGSLGVYDDYLSKRLLFTCMVNKERRFLKIISGEVLNVQRFLACAIENNCLLEKPLIPDVLKKYL
ncbi:hypothetical protein Zmor_009106 [Zophobas morio]|uniref:Serine--tRNA ligase, mitochondrial n=1 Tax=Zophobas morio TaxID=2755281 RepID=A0AA38MHC5_9CUCU|nr:hypothetical protein Zmor_009106 [Zophobas morio]